MTDTGSNQQHHGLVIACEDCGADVVSRFHAIEGCFTGYCAVCGFLTVQTSTLRAVKIADAETGGIAA
jgi:hypothetical protein